MKKQLYLLFLTLTCLSAQAQITFEKGYIIDSLGVKTECFIRNNEWKSNPARFQYKLSETGEAKWASVKDVREFSVYNTFRFISQTVLIDRSSEDMNQLSEESAPDFKEETLFLEVLMEGKANLYKYEDGSLLRFFFNKDGGTIQQLVFKSYFVSATASAQNNAFRQQLEEQLTCKDLSKENFQQLSYARNELMRVFRAYNTCEGVEPVVFEKSNKKMSVHLLVRPRLNISSFELENSSSSYRRAQMSSKPAFGIGLQAEFVLPYNKGKWALLAEPVFQYFSGESSRKSSSVLNTDVITSVSYKSVEAQVGLRHYFMLNEQAALFLNAAHILDISFASSVVVEQSNGQNRNELKVDGRRNWGIGAGFRYKNKFSAELRYQTPRDIVGSYLLWNSSYKTSSLVLGYRLL